MDVGLPLSPQVHCCCDWCYLKWSSPLRRGERGREGRERGGEGKGGREGERGGKRGEKGGRRKGREGRGEME